VSVCVSVSVSVCVCECVCVCVFVSARALEVHPWLRFCLYIHATILLFFLAHPEGSHIPTSGMHAGYVHVSVVTHRTLT